MGQHSDPEASVVGRAVYLAVALGASGLLGMLVADALTAGKRSLVVASGVEATVRSGPVWLVRLAYQPPTWLTGALLASLLVVGALAAVGYRRHGLTPEVLTEASTNALAGIGALAAAHAVGSLTAWPWPAQVAVAGTIGWAGAVWFRGTLDAVLSSEEDSDE
jgi:hypothetical protein